MCLVGESVLGGLPGLPGSSRARERTGVETGGTCRPLHVGEGDHDSASPVYWRQESLDAVPTLMMDYYYMNDGPDQREQDDAEKTNPMIAIKDRRTKCCWSAALPAKGADPYAIDVCVECIKESGYKRFTYKSDNEAAILALKAKVAEKLGEAIELI